MSTPNYSGLIEAIRRRKLVVVVDLPLSTTRTNELSKNDMVNKLKSKLSVAGEYTFEQMVELGIRKQGKENFLPLLNRTINQSPNVAQGYYELFEKLDIKYIIDAHYSSLFRTAITDGAVQGKYSFYSRDDDFSFDSEGQIIVSLFGDTEYNKDKLITLQNEFNGFFANANSISSCIQSILKSTILFIDFDPNSDRFKSVYDFMCRRNEQYPSEAFLIGSVKVGQLSYGSQENLTTIETDAYTFLENILNQLISSAPIADNDISGVETLPQVPYKYLLSFEQNEHRIFFGRKREISELSLRVRGSSQVSILTSLSGYGKTSMIKAGLIPNLLATQDYDVFYTRSGSNPWESVISGVFKETPKNFDLNSADISSLFNKQYQLIIIDQFEECLVDNTDDDLADIDKKMKMLFDRFPTVSVLISIRQDFFAYLTKFKFLKSPFTSTYNLELLSVGSATDAIKKPTEFELYDFSYEEGLVEQIVKDLSSTEYNSNAYIDPSQLQIVCYFLYQELKNRQSNVVTAEIYNELGKANGILENYIDESLKNYDHKRQRLGKEILKCLVSSKGTRIPKTSHDIIVELSTNDTIKNSYLESEIKFMIELLVNTRLLRIRNQSENEQVYELTHEYIIRKITEWMDAETLKIKEVTELLRVEYTKWSLYRTITMPQIQYEEIWKYRARINFTPQEKSYVLLCLLSYPDYRKEEIQYWISLNRNNASCDADLTFAMNNFKGKRRILAGILLHTLYPEDGIADKICTAFTGNINPHLNMVEDELKELGEKVDSGLLRKLHDLLNKARYADMCAVLSASSVRLGLLPKTRDEIIKKHDLGKGFKQFFPDKEREVNFPLYQIDTYTVTNQMYAEFDESHRYNKEQADYPVVGINAEQALSYAHWWGKDLPTEDEWEYAARGTDFRYFPWGGNDWDYETEKKKEESDKLCNTSLTGTDGARSSKEYPKGKSPFGCFNMAGNVWEWTKTPVPNDEARLYVKGGSWSMFEIMPWAWYRYALSRESGQQNLGFRCVLRGEV